MLHNLVTEYCVILHTQHTHQEDMLHNLVTEYCVILHTQHTPGGYVTQPSY